MAEKLIADNRKARHEYHFVERVEAGLALVGTEVKSLREGQADIQRAYGELRDGREIDSLAGKVNEKGLTLVPTRMYWKGGKAKVELALARGKQARDKRRDIAKRDAEREMERALKARG